MIRRRQGDDFLLITQVAHAQLSGRLAEFVGNELFAKPTPFAEGVRAIAMHDDGWPLHDDAPTLNAQGEPAHTFETPLETVLPIWLASTDLAVKVHPYAGLLVSLHGLALSLFAEAQDPAKPPRHTSREMFEINKFQHRQIEIQEDLRRQLHMRTDRPLRYGLAEPGRSPEEDQLLCNFHLLQLLDQLSLDLCFDEARFTSVNKVFPQPGDRSITVHIAREQAGEFTLSPWPFSESILSIPLPAKRIPARRYTSDEDLHRAIAEAANDVVHLRLHGSEPNVAHE